ncbi:hypothetical protein EV368DRAFT_61504 [Lentinula lateritia]|nr:hypothetical protein EV368DRAFT_61504 [Lentinula lateritia]
MHTVRLATNENSGPADYNSVDIHEAWHLLNLFGLFGYIRCSIVLPCLFKQFLVRESRSLYYSVGYHVVGTIHGLAEKVPFYEDPQHGPGEYQARVLPSTESKQIDPKI